VNFTSLKSQAVLTVFASSCLSSYIAIRSQCIVTVTMSHSRTQTPLPLTRDNATLVSLRADSVSPSPYKEGGRHTASVEPTQTPLF
jgi:hypothetical protein